MCRERGVEEEADFRSESRGSQDRRNEHQMIVMYPYQVARPADFEHFSGKQLVGFLVLFPPSRLISQEIGKIM